MLKIQPCFLPEEQECAACMNGECQCGEHIYVQCNSKFGCPYTASGICHDGEYDCTHCRDYQKTKKKIDNNLRQFAIPEESGVMVITVNGYKHISISTFCEFYMDIEDTWFNPVCFPWVGIGQIMEVQEKRVC